MVAPPFWVEAVRAPYTPTYAPPALTQLALANFMESGAYDRHLRASRLRFRRRRDALLAALDRLLPGYPVRGTAIGLHLLLGLPDATDMPRLVAAAHRRDMEICDPAELYFRPAPPQSWLPLGYANLNDSLVEEAVALLAELLKAGHSLSCDEKGRKAPHFVAR